MTDWTIVVPVKGTRSAKSRLGGSPELAIAIALDTVAVAISVAKVVVVCPEPLAPSFAALGARVVPDPAAGLISAIERGIEAAGDGPVAVMLGDLPALKPEELAAALAAASEVDRAMVADADGVGTTLVTARAGIRHLLHFGRDSRERHRAAGYVELDVAVDSGLRRDVDTAAQLAALAGRVGVRTAARLESRSHPTAP